MKISVANLDTTMVAVITKKPFEEISSSLAEFQATLAEGEVCQIANVNSPSQVVLTGTTEAVTRGLAHLKGKKIARASITLPVSAPFHSILMKPGEFPCLFSSSTPPFNSQTQPLRSCAQNWNRFKSSNRRCL